MLQTINASHHVCIHTDPTHYSSFWWPEKKFGQFFTSSSSLFSPKLKLSTMNMNMNNGYREPDNSFCYFHPKEVVVGVCALCLTERLLILAARKGHHRSTQSFTRRKPPITLPKIFAFSYFLNRKSDYLDQEASTSQEGNFFSSLLVVNFSVFVHLQMLVAIECCVIWIEDLYVFWGYCVSMLFVWLNRFIG